MLLDLFQSIPALRLHHLDWVWLLGGAGASAHCAHFQWGEWSHRWDLWRCCQYTEMVTSGWLV